MFKTSSTIHPQSCLNTTQNIWPATGTAGQKYYLWSVSPKAEWYFWGKKKNIIGLIIILTIEAFKGSFRTAHPYYSDQEILVYVIHEESLKYLHLLYRISSTWMVTMYKILIFLFFFFSLHIVLPNQTKSSAPAEFTRGKMYLLVPIIFTSGFPS